MIEARTSKAKKRGHVSSESIESTFFRWSLSPLGRSLPIRGMSMIRKCLLGLAPLLLLTACFGALSSATLVPVAGPLLDAHTAALKVLMSGSLTGQGTVQVTMPGGEIVCGEFQTLTGYSNSTDFGSGSAIPGQMVVTRDDWKAAYGSGMDAGEKIHGLLSGTGEKGTLLSGEYIVDPMEGHGFGVAKDNRGNLYRLTFSTPEYY